MFSKNLIDRFGVDGESFGQQPIRFGIVPLGLLVKSLLRQACGSIRTILGVAILHTAAPFVFCNSPTWFGNTRR
jgi:hypothetical protein